MVPGSRTISGARLIYASGRLVVGGARQQRRVVPGRRRHRRKGCVGLACIRDPVGDVLTPDVVRSGEYRVNVGGRLYPATVHLRPPFDPAGGRVKGRYQDMSRAATRTCSPWTPPASTGRIASMSLRERLAAGGFAVTAEISPPRGASTASVTKVAALLRDWVDAANITDNQASHVRLASWAGSLAALAAGLEPVMQMTCRDRNRIALQSDLLGASALGIRNVLVMTGDHPKFGDHPEAKPVFDLDSVQLLRALRTMRDEHTLLSGRTVDPPPDCFLGAVENPFVLPVTVSAERLGQKVAAGAQFVQTQFVFDVPAFSGWMAQVRDLGLDERCYILAGVGIVRSRRALDFIRDKVPGVHVPDDVYRRLRAVPADRTAAEGERLAAETVRQVSQIPGVAGVHLLTSGSEHAVPAILDGAGVRDGR